MSKADLELVDGRPALRIERRLDHSVERVWRAITDPDELRRWYPGVPEWTLEPGVRFTSEGANEAKGLITEVDPPHLIAYEWDGELFRFQLSPDGDGCLLKFMHVFDDRTLGGQHAAGWEIYFNRLDAHLAGGFLSEEEAHEAVAELQRGYADQFGLEDEGPQSGPDR
jgi:uncharacterized protein YndB with AHSA1/START domain